MRLACWRTVAYPASYIHSVIIIVIIIIIIIRPIILQYDTSCNVVVCCNSRSSGVRRTRPTHPGKGVAVTDVVHDATMLGVRDPSTTQLLRFNMRLGETAYQECLHPSTSSADSLTAGHKEPKTGVCHYMTMHAQSSHYLIPVVVHVCLTTYLPTNPTTWGLPNWGGAP